jgi:sulfur carrier protein ThiS
VRVKLQIPGVGEKEVQANSVADILQKLEVPEGYEVRLIRGEEVLRENSTIREGDNIQVMPVLRGA